MFLLVLAYIILGGWTAWKMTQRFPLAAKDDDSVLSWVIFWPLWVWFLMTRIDKDKTA